VKKERNLYPFYPITHIAYLIKYRRLLLNCPISQMTFSYRITGSKTINQSIHPYVSVPFILYIPPQHNNPNFHTLKGSKKAANRVAAHQPKQGDRPPAQIASFPSQGAMAQIFSLFTQQHTFRKLGGTIISKTPKPLSKCTQNWPSGLKLRKNRTFNQSHFL